jgi:hypothetical protein
MEYRDSESFDAQWEKDHPLEIWKLSTKNEFWYYLEVLPPLHWATITHDPTGWQIESFKCSEPNDHRGPTYEAVYTCCAKIGLEYYISFQRHSTTNGEIAEQLVKHFENSMPCKPLF